MFFEPAWKKDAKGLVKGAKKFVHYKRDLLSEVKLKEIESRRQDLIKAIKENDKGKVEEASKFLKATCDGALRSQKPQSWFEENVEVMFVAIVIALGLRTYYLQPFRIPTGSMQPTLNGIVGTQESKEEWPGFGRRAWEYISKGRSYVKVVMKEDRRIARNSKGGPLIVDDQFMHFLSRSYMYFVDSKPTFFTRLFGTDPLRLPAPQNPSLETGLEKALIEASSNGLVIRKGTVLCEGYVDTGDLVLVDKFSYHFRKPKRGEVFVFDTIGIKGIKEHSGSQAGGSHYIKRLVGVPGDELSIQEPNLYVNGKIAKESGIQRVAAGGAPFKEDHDGYVHGRYDNKEHLTMYLAQPGDVLKLVNQNASPGMREYAALGDNTGNSLDSRYWGSVKEFNLVGPALFSLWPFDTGHWGFIK